MTESLSPPPPPSSPTRTKTILDHRVSWGIPTTDQLAIEDKENERERLGPGFVRRSQSIRTIDRVTPTAPVLLHDVLLYKMRRIRGGFALVYVSLCITCVNEEDHFIYHISMTYRERGSFNTAQKMKGHVLTLERTDDSIPSKIKLPCSGCGITMECVLDSGKKKKYEFCANEEKIADKFAETFVSAERHVVNEVNEQPSLKISRVAAEGARRLQIAKLTAGKEKLEELVEIYDKCVKMEEGRTEERHNNDDPNIRLHLVQDQDIAREVLSLYMSVFEHLVGDDKEGGSLQIARLDQLIDMLTKLVVTCKRCENDLLACFVRGNQHWEPFIETIALAAIVVQDLQFGMADLDKYRRERQQVLLLKQRLYELPVGIEARMTHLLTPPQNRKRVPDVVEGECSEE